MPNRTDNKTQGRHCLAATLQPETFNEESREVDVIAYTGAAVWRGGLFAEPYQLRFAMDGDVRLDRLNGGAPLLDTHADYSLDNVIGGVVPGSASIKDGQLRARVFLLDHPDNSRVIAGVQQGAIRNISMGAAVHGKPEVMEGGGERGSDLHVVTSWEPMELSLVPVPADAGAHVLSAGTPSAEVTEMSEPKTEAKPAVDEHKLRAEGAKIERERLAGIETARKRLNLAADHPEVLRCIGTDGAPGLSLAESRAALIGVEVEAFETASTSPVVRVTKDHRDAVREGAKNAILARIGVADVQLGAQGPEKVADRVKLTDAGRAFMRHSLLDLARESLAADGVRLAGMNNRDIADLVMSTTAAQMRDPSVRALLRARREGRPMHHLHGISAQGTSDFTDIVASVQHKSLLAGYASEPQSWRLFSEQVPIADYKAMHVIELAEFGHDTTALNELEEYPFITTSDAEEEWTASKYGRRFALSREAIIDDDLGAFSMMPPKLGRLFNRIESAVVWALFSANSGAGRTFDQDSNNWFDSSNHSNVGSDGGVPTEARINELIELGLGQTGPTPPSGTAPNQMVSFRYIIYPTTLHSNVGPIFRERHVPTASTAGVMVPAAADLQMIPTSYLTGNPWYVVAGPADSGIKYGWVGGNEGPQIEESEDSSIDALVWKVRDEFGASVVHWRGAAYNAGA